MNKYMCSAGENSLTVGIVLPGLQNGKPTCLPRYSELAGLLLGISRCGDSWYDSLSGPSFPWPLPILLLIFQQLKQKERSKRYVTNMSKSAKTLTIILCE